MRDKTSACGGPAAIALATGGAVNPAAYRAGLCNGARRTDSRNAVTVLKWTDGVTGSAHAPLTNYYGEFVDAGGKITLCPHRAAAGIGEDALREDASIGTDAHRILDCSGLNWEFER